MMLLAQQRVPIDQWRDPIQQTALVARLADALHGTPEAGYSVSHTFTDTYGAQVAVDSPEALNAIVTVNTWKD